MHRGTALLLPVRRALWMRAARFCGALLALTLIHLAFPARAHAQAAVEVGALDGSLSIGSAAQVLRQPNGASTSEDVALLGSDDFRPTGSNHPNFGFTRDVLWFRFSLHNSASSSREYVLDATREWVDDVRLYDATGASPTLAARSGARVPLRARPVPTERIAFPLTLSAGETRTWLLRVAGTSPLSFQAVLSSREEYVRQQAWDELLFGGYYAILLGLAAYSFLLFAALRDRTQLLVGTVLAGHAVAEATSHGHVSRLLPAGAGWLELGGGAFGFVFVSAATLRLAGVALDTARTLPRVDRMLRASFWPVMVLVALPVLVPAWHMLVFVGLLATAVLVALACAIRLRRPDRKSWNFTLAIGALLLPGIVTLGTLFGVFPAYPAVEYGNHVGVIAMSCLFALLVAAAIRTDRERVQSLNEELRFQVAARSRELGQILRGTASSFVAERLSAGDTFDGRYLVRRELGAGGMGAVYEVERLADGERLALKVVTGEVTGLQAARFAREAEIGARVRHRNLVSIVDVGVAARGTPFLVMELVEGGSMEGQRARFGDSRWAIPILRQIASGLNELHSNGVIHRDLKPANVLLVEGESLPVAKISDFGISRFGALVDSGDVAVDAPTLRQRTEGPPYELTQEGTLLGTPLYMPPEASLGPARQPSADIFSFGILAYEALTGRSPFAVAPILLLRSGRPIPDPLPLREVPEALASLVLACLRFEASKRPRAKDLAERI
jgi:hypothetical protein